jgi:glucose-6-phosphate isomerase
MISLNIEKTFGFISKEKVFTYEAEVKAAQEMLEKGTGKGNDFLGWCVKSQNYGDCDHQTSR